MDAFFWLSTFFVLLGTQWFVAQYVRRPGLNVLEQIGVVLGVAFVSALIWYGLADKYDWALPSRRGAGVPHPRHDAGVVFVMGCVWYLIAIVGRGDGRK